MDRKTHTAGYVAAIVGASSLYLALLWQLHPLPLCTLHYLTGLHCPFCGGTRAVISVLQGDITGAIAMNPILVLIGPAAGIFLLRPAWLCRQWVLWVTVGILTAYTIARNIPCWPFDSLAPA